MVTLQQWWAHTTELQQRGLSLSLSLSLSLPLSLSPSLPLHTHHFSNVPEVTSIQQLCWPWGSRWASDHVGWGLILCVFVEVLQFPDVIKPLGCIPTTVVRPYLCQIKGKKTWIICFVASNMPQIILLRDSAQIFDHIQLLYICGLNALIVGHFGTQSYIKWM